MTVTGDTNPSDDGMDIKTYINHALEAGPTTRSATASPRPRARSLRANAAESASATTTRYAAASPPPRARSLRANAAESSKRDGWSDRW